MPCTDESDWRRGRCRSAAFDCAPRPSLTPGPLPSRKMGRARVTIAGAGHVARPSNAPAMSARAAQTSYISQKVAGSSGRKVKIPRQSMICPCTEILRRKPGKRPKTPGGRAKPLALPAAARTAERDGGRGAGAASAVKKARPRAGGEDPATGAAPAPRGAYDNWSYDAYSVALDLAWGPGAKPNFGRDMAMPLGVYWQRFAASGRSHHQPGEGSMARRLAACTDDQHMFLAYVVNVESVWR